MPECILHGGRLGGTYCGPDCDRLTRAQMASETPAEPTGPIVQPSDGAGSEDIPTSLDLSWPEFQRLLKASRGDLAVEHRPGATATDLGVFSLVVMPDTMWAYEDDMRMREEATTDGRP